MTQQGISDRTWIAATDMFTALIPGVLVLLSASAFAGQAQENEPQGPAIEELEAKVAELSDFDLDALEQSIRDAETECDRLSLELADLLAAANADQESEGLTTYKLRADLKPEFVMLTRNRVVPIREPYYTFESCMLRTANGGLRFGSEVKRVQDGEDVDKALSDDGCLPPILTEIKSGEGYLQFLVCSDSIAAFRSLMGPLQERGVAFSWDPGADKTLYATSESAGAAAVSQTGQ